MTLEHKIQNDIRVAVSKNNCIIFRTNVGKVKTYDGRWFATGLPKGFPDLMGIRLSDKQAFFIECKNETGRPRKEQIRFHQALKHYGIIHGIARSPEDAVKIAKKGLIGYGFEKYEK